MEIVSSRVSVYEVVLDLANWEQQSTDEAPGFPDALIRFLPSTREHKCVSGEAGGFHAELRKGTNFGHVIEHVLLELIRLADPEDREFSGWTKSLGGGRYVVHYGAPDFLTGRLAAILAVEAVRRLLAGTRPELTDLLADLRDPMAYFARQEHPLGEGPAVPVLSRAVPEDAGGGDPSADLPPALDGRQVDNLRAVMQQAAPRLPEVDARWREAFGEFGGDFARGILDKVEILNPDRFVDRLDEGDFRGYLQGAGSIGAMLRSLGIPVDFVTRSIWLYKNQLQLVVIEMLEGDHERLAAAVWDLDSLFQNLLHSVLQGYARGEPTGDAGAGPVLRGFRARHAGAGRILVVDDDALARRLAVNILRLHGFATVTARDGISALRELADGEGRVDLVLLDVVLPGIGGLAVCRRIRESHPTVKVILCSGFPLDRETGDCLTEHEVAFLQKPFRSEELVAAARHLCDLDCTGNAARG